MSSTLTGRERCPNCAAEGRDTSADNLAVYNDGHKYCYSCGYIEGDAIESPDCTYEYLPHRGLTRKTLELYDIKTKVAPDGQPLSVGFIHPDQKVKVRSWDRKEYYWATPGDTSKTGLFGRDKFTAGSHRDVVITEGMYDAPSCNQVLRIPSVSVHSSVTAARDVIVDRSWVDSHQRIYLAFDGDAAGRAACRAVAKLFDYNKVYVVDLARADRKDASDYVQAGEDDVLRNCFANAKRYLPDTIISSFGEFRKILLETPTKGIPYPFPTLNELTDGIRRGESVLITAPEGVGKTEVMHAIEYHLLKETKDAIGAIYLEEPKGRHLQALAGLQLKRPVHLADSGVSPDQVMAAVQECVKDDDRLHLYNHFGADDPDILLDTVRFLCTARNVNYVLLDHIGMVVSGLAGEDERRALDYIVSRLEMMVKELNISLIFVSHVNDFGQTRGSRLISKICDIRIDISRDVAGGSSIVDMLVVKNRPTGKTGQAGSYMFDPFTRQYTEINGETPWLTSRSIVPDISDISDPVLKQVVNSF